MTTNAIPLTSPEALGTAGMMMPGSDAVKCCRMSRWAATPRRVPAAL